jgi:hypothetical protein
MAQLETRAALGARAMDAWFEQEVGRHEVSVWIFYRGIW